MAAEPSRPERPVVSARSHTLTSLGAMAAALVLALFGEAGWVWLPVGVLALAWLSLVSTMWETVRTARGGMTPLRAVALLVVPGLHLVGPLWAIGGYPRAFEAAAEEHGLSGERPSRGVFVAFAISWMLLVAAATVVVAIQPRDLVALEILLPPAFVWLPLSLAVTWQAARSVNALAAARAPTDRRAAADRDWARDRQTVLDARRSRDPVDRAWAEDMLARYATRGVKEAAKLRRPAHGEIRVGRLRGPLPVPVVEGLVAVRPLAAE